MGSKTAATGLQQACHPVTFVMHWVSRWIDQKNPQHCAWYRRGFHEGKKNAIITNH
jgi:hypothetical protein